MSPLDILFLLRKKIILRSVRDAKLVANSDDSSPVRSPRWVAKNGPGKREAARSNDSQGDLSRMILVGGFSEASTQDTLNQTPKSPYDYVHGQLRVREGSWSWNDIKDRAQCVAEGREKNIDWPFLCPWEALDKLPSDSEMSWTCAQQRRKLLKERKRKKILLKTNKQTKINPNTSWQNSHIGY